MNILTIISDKQSEQMSAKELEKFVRLDGEITKLLKVQAETSLQIAEKLWQIYNEQLYLHGDYQDIISYAKAKHKFAKAYTYFLIAASTVAKGLREKSTRVDLLLPENERQLRPLTKNHIARDPNQIEKIWAEAVSQSDGKQPSSRLVSKIAKEMYPTPKRKPSPTKYKLAVTALDDCSIAELKRVLDYLQKRLEKQ